MTSGSHRGMRRVHPHQLVWNHQSPIVYLLELSPSAGPRGLQGIFACSTGSGPPPSTPFTCIFWVYSPLSFGCPVLYWLCFLLLTVRWLPRRKLLQSIHFHHQAAGLRGAVFPGGVGEGTVGNQHRREVQQGQPHEQDAPGTEAGKPATCDQGTPFQSLMLLRWLGAASASVHHGGWLLLLPFKLAPLLVCVGW